jgi:hypothetical protein
MQTLRQPASTALYPRLVGAAWSALAGPLQRLHLGLETVQATGMFTVRHGTWPVARLLAALLRLPMAGEDVPIRLVVTPHRHGERWQRTFAEGSLVSEQDAGPEGCLGERFGLLDIQFRLAVIDRTLYFRQEGVGLSCGVLRVPLLRWLSPQITAREWAIPGQAHVQVAVSVRVPPVGLLLAYTGAIVTEEGQE